MALQERLLALGGERAVHCFARVRQPQGEQEDLGADPVEVDPEIREVDLGLRGGRVQLRDESLLRGPAGFSEDLRAAPRDVVPHRGVGQLAHRVLVDQPGPDPPGGVTLLARRDEVLAQPAVDDRLRRVQLRRGERAWLAWWRGRRVQRLAHRAPVHPVPGGELPDREFIAAVIAADGLVDLHPRPHIRPLPPVVAASMAPTRQGWGQTAPSRRPGRVADGAN